MCPRPRTIPDDVVITHTITLLAERPREVVRLLDVALACGLAPATLVQRFGSREALFEAVARAAPGRLQQIFDERSDPSPAGHLGSVLKPHADSDLVRLHRAILSLGFPLPALALELRKSIGLLLAEAVDAGELPHCDVGEAARRIQAHFYGLLLNGLLTGAEPPAEPAFLDQFML